MEIWYWLLFHFLLHMRALERMKIPVLVWVSLRILKVLFFSYKITWSLKHMATILKRNKNIGNGSLKTYHLPLVLRRPWSLEQCGLLQLIFYAWLLYDCYFKHQHFRVYGHLCIGGSMLLGKRVNSHFKNYF